MRKTLEWIAKHDDQAIPRYVRARIFETHNGICHISGRKIMPGDAWDCEHKLALCLGGEHRENNIAPALVAPHRIKTKGDRHQKKKNDRVRRRHIGIRKPRTITRWRKFNGEIVNASKER
jgi:hypothetical protein